MKQNSYFFRPIAKGEIQGGFIMKKTPILVIGLILAGSSSFLTGCAGVVPVSKQSESEYPIEVTDTPPLQVTEEDEVTSVVENFGRKLKLVSLLAPEDVVKQSIEENYREFLSPSLLSAWLNNPETAIGRLVSSPWPERIDIRELNKTSDNTYEVNGVVIEVTSVEKENNMGNPVTTPITLIVKNIDGSWLIDSIIVNLDAEDGSVLYKNTDYGFVINLPGSWRNYRLVTDKWEGFSIESNGETVETGSMVIIRHPKWKKDAERQDIPIMIFTMSQWNALTQDQFHIGAAPMNPTELGRNQSYVFALPARYNYAFPQGFEEVEEILQSGALQPLELIKKNNEK